MIEPEGVNMPIDGTLDLHTFDPRDVRELVPDYLSACLEQGILQVRIIHGKGTGTLRRMVESVVKKLPYVDSYKTGDETSGSWGAMIVTLKEPDSPAGGR